MRVDNVFFSSSSELLFCESSVLPNVWRKRRILRRCLCIYIFEYISVVVVWLYGEVYSIHISVFRLRKFISHQNLTQPKWKRYAQHHCYTPVTHSCSTYYSTVFGCSVHWNVLATPQFIHLIEGLFFHLPHTLIFHSKISLKLYQHTHAHTIQTVQDLNDFH